MAKADMATETIADLVPDPSNCRRHNPRNIGSIVNSLQAVGAARSIVIDENNRILAGNGLVEAAGEAGIEKVIVVEADGNTIIAVRRRGLTEKQKAQLAISDNRTAELAEWDAEQLLKSIAEFEIDPQTVEFTQGELDAILAKSDGKREVVEDEVPDEADVVTRCKAGDLWKLGDHRMLCGDSTKAEDVARLMDGERATCVVTDPPYGVSIGAKNRFLNSIQPSERCLETIESDDLSPENLKSTLLPAFMILRSEIMADDCTLFVTAPQGGELCMMMMMMREAGLPPRHVLIWKKNQPTFSMGRLDYDYAHEPILLTWGKRHKRPMCGTHKTSVWEIDRNRKCDDHPTMKPVALYVNAYANNSDPKDNVADIYAGSGTAFIAAEQLGRRCFGMEISPTYCDVILARWEKLTGKKAERVDG